MGDKLSYHRAGFGQGGQIFDIQCYHEIIDFLRQSVVLQKLAKRFRRGGETARHAHPGLAELADQLAQRRILATNRGNVVFAERG